METANTQKSATGKRTPWMGVVPRFRSEAPPADWIRQHDTAIDHTLLNPQTRSGHSLTVNRPVPRQASCHFYGIDADPRNVYFY